MTDDRVKQIDKDPVPGRWIRTVPTLLAATMVFWATWPGNARADEHDTAQQLLFDSAYLETMTPPAGLVYRFEHRTSDEEAYGKSFSDTVHLNLSAPSGGHRLNDVRLDIFPQTRNRHIGPFFDMTGNPIIMVFLERDLHDTLRRVRATPVLFRNTIRKAMREAAVIDDVDIIINGETITGKRVTIAPFAGDGIPPQFAGLSGKRYQFTVSDAVPGGFYEIVSIQTDPKDDQRVLLTDRITYEAMDK